MDTGTCKPNERREIMGYRKAKFYVRKRDDKIELVDGYTFEACFSDGMLHMMAVHKSLDKHGLWTVTDWHTGYAVCYGKTRVDAVTKFQQTYLSKLERMVYSNDHVSEFMNWYEAKTKELVELIDRDLK